MLRKAAIGMIFLVCMLMSMSGAQSLGPSTIPQVANRVFRVSCTDNYVQGTKRIVQTGFYTTITIQRASIKVIWTALHGAVRCKESTIRAENETPILIANLRIAWVDEIHDVALLVPEDKASIGQEIRSEIQPLKLAQEWGKIPNYWVIGYPLGTLVASTIPTSLDKPNYLIDVVSSDYRGPLAKRNSPHTCLVVQQINGPGIVNRGMSGSPLVNTDGLVYGMVDGGIGRKGQESETIGWVTSAFPLSTNNSCSDETPQVFDWQDWENFIRGPRKEVLITDSNGLVTFPYDPSTESDEKPSKTSLSFGLVPYVTWSPSTSQVGLWVSPSLRLQLQPGSCFDWTVGCYIRGGFTMGASFVPTIGIIPYSLIEGEIGLTDTNGADVFLGIASVVEHFDYGYFYLGLDLLLSNPIRLGLLARMANSQGNLFLQVALRLEVNLWSIAF